MSLLAWHDREFYHKLGGLMVPIAFQSFMLAAVGASDAAMLGRVSQDALAAVSLATQVQFVQNSFLFALCVGATVLSAQYWGKGDTRTVERIFCLILRYASLVSLVFFGLCLLVPETLMRIFTSEEALIAIGADYLRIVSWSYPLIGASQCYLCMMKIGGQAKASAAVSTTAVLVNVALNAILIFGLLGLPAMEAGGAALATVIARVIELAMAMRVAFRPGCPRPHSKDLFRLSPALERDYWHYCLPIMINELIWGIGITSYSVIIGHLGSDATAANSVAAVVKNLITCLCRGISSGGGILIGNVLGAGELEKGKEYGRRVSLLSVLCGFVSAGLVLLSGPLVSSFMVLTEAAEHYLRIMLWICAFYMVGKSINVTVIGGIFNAGGDTRFDAVSIFLSMWLVIIPLSAAAAFWWQWPVLAVYFIISMDECVKLPWVYRHYKMYKWVRNITREEIG